MTRLRADVLLLICALIWGTAFVAQKNLAAGHWPLLFVCFRFAISAVLLAPLAWWESRRAGASTPAAPRDLGLAVAVGLCVCVAGSMQQVAMTSTSATNGGFLTAVYVAFVPFVVWAVARTPPRGVVLLACAITVCGAWLLAGNGAARGWSRGDLVILASDLIWAVHITLVARFLGRLNRPFLLCFVQYAVTALGAGLAGALTERASAAQVGDALVAILYAGIASGGVAYTLQIVAQRHTPAPEAALIMSLESVFAALAGALLLNERLTAPALAGCALILLGAVMVELAPALRRGVGKVMRGET
jgi:drug/metabolite transporter (DMT)-like permease